jgi:hypothetical protein
MISRAEIYQEKIVMLDEQIRWCDDCIEAAQEHKKVDLGQAVHIEIQSEGIKRNLRILKKIYKRKLKVKSDI